MIRGVYLNTMNDDLSECRKIYHQVFGKTNNDDMNAEQWRENDNIEDMAIYLLLYNENEVPVGAARLIFDLTVCLNSMDYRYSLNTEKKDMVILLCI